MFVKFSPQCDRETVMLTQNVISIVLEDTAEDYIDLFVRWLIIIYLSNTSINANYSVGYI